jgi:uncharacterized protein YqfB (UPF0267 family)
VLPLLRKELRVVLCPNKVIVMALSNRLHRKVILRAALPVIPDNTSDWHPAIAALDQWLTANGLGKAGVKIWLSSCFLRFAMMPFSDGVSSYAERLTVAGLLMESIYGENASHWKLTLDDEKYGEPCLISAMDSELWEAFNQMFIPKQSKIISIQPYVASVRNSFNNQIQDGDSLLAVVEDEQVVLVETKNKRISGIRKTMLTEDSGELGFVGLLRREMLISGLTEDSAKIFLHVTNKQDRKIQAGSGIDIITLHDEGKSDSEAGYEMAGLKEINAGRVDLDFCKIKVRSNATAGILMLLTGLVIAAWMAVMHNDTKVEQLQIQSKLAQMKTANPQKSLSDNTDQENKQQLQRATAVIEQLSFPWNKLFQAIEENAGKDIALLSVHPDMLAKTVVLDAEAKNWSGMMSYIKRFEQDRFFTDVHLLSHQTQQSDPQRPVRFKLSCAWGNK